MAKRSFNEAAIADSTESIQIFRVIAGNFPLL